MATLVRHGVRYAESVSNDIECIIIEVETRQRKLSIANVYYPPGATTADITFNDIVAKRNLLVVGDLNAHHTIFGSTTCNTRGRMLEQLIDKHDLTVISTGTCTYTGHAGNESPIDVHHCGLVGLARTWDGTDCEFDSWLCRIHIPCS